MKIFGSVFLAITLSAFAAEAVEEYVEEWLEHRFFSPDRRYALL